MYTTILALHSWLRWLALGAGIAATVAAARETPATSSHGSGVSGASKSMADRLGTILIGTLDLQLLLGLAMYLGLSPTMTAIRANFGASMKDPAARFWAVEHVTTMLCAVIVAHVGKVLARKSTDANSRRMKLLISFGVATILMLLAIPWPGLRAGRPLFWGL